MRRTIFGLLGCGLLLSGSAWAEEDNAGRGVARLSLINGDVSVRRGDSGDWVAAAVNAPLVVYDHVLTGAGSRAEIQFDWANMLRLSSDTDVRFSELENSRYQTQLARGTVTIGVLRDSGADFEVDTPSVSVRPKRRGEYRITVNDNGESEITVRSGEAEVFTPKGVETIRPGRTMLVRGSPSDPEFQYEREIAYDNWDRWNHDRDRRLERTRSYQYVSRDIYGADDLDYYGRWMYVPPYGWVWSPNSVGVDWAPYRYGRWSWIDYYGWSWVDYSPWGWAPYHYGRWFWGRPYGWCWYPGPIYGRHFWRPGLVAFFGFGGGGFNLGFGFGNVGWVPLAPYEPYYPWYGRRYYGGYSNNTVFNNIRIVNNTNITNIYRNARVVNGVTAIDSGEFVRGRSGRSLRLTGAELRSASLVQGPVPLTPSRDSLRLSDRTVGNIRLPRNEPTRFYSRRPAAAVERVPFDQQQRGMDRIVRNSFGERAGAPGAAASGSLPRVDRTDAVARSAGQGNAPLSRTGETGAWRRIGESPATRNEAGTISRTDQGPRSAPEMGAGRVDRRADESWRRFGASQPQNRGSEAPARIDRTPEVGGGGRIERRQDVPRRESNDGWNRFGSQPHTEQLSAPRVDRSPDVGRRESNAGSNRFGSQPRSEQPSAPRVDRSPDSGRRQNFRSESGGNWQGFGSLGGGQPQLRSTEPPARMEMPRSEPRSMPRFESQQPIRINPPIVRERSGSAPRFERPSGGGFSRGGGGAARMGGGEMRGGGGVSRIEGGGGARGGGSGGRGGRNR